MCRRNGSPMLSHFVHGVNKFFDCSWTLLLLILLVHDVMDMWLPMLCNPTSYHKIGTKSCPLQDDKKHRCCPK